MTQEKVCIIGAGNFGTALAYQLAKSCNQITVFSIEQEVVDSINNKHINKKYLPTITLQPHIKATKSYEEAMQDAKYIIVSVPSHIIEIVLKEMHPHFKEGMIIVNTAKGLDEKRLCRMSELISLNVPEYMKKEIVSMSGPSIANEMANDVPTAIAIASENQNILEDARNLFSNDKFQVLINHDLAGIEYGGFFKNVIAIAAGMCDGLNLGTNLKAAVVTRGFYEISKIAEKCGADPKTLTGLSGLGDLIVTSFSEHSRNRRFGEAIAKGKSFDEATKEIGQVVEGVRATKAAIELAKRENIELCLIKEIYNILYNNKDPKTALTHFFEEENSHEFRD